MIARGKIPPFIATLGMLTVGRGLTLGGGQVEVKKCLLLGDSSLIHRPLPLILHRSVFGNYIFAIGGGEETARLAGISPAKIKFGVYIISALAAGLTGLLLTARLWSAQPNSGTGLELDAIASSVLGGASLLGGAGSVAGAVIGAFIIGILANGLNLLEVPSYNQQVIKGLVFIVAVILDYVLKRRSKSG
jgi:ribose transport system permease protein